MQSLSHRSRRTDPTRPISPPTRPFLHLVLALSPPMGIAIACLLTGHRDTHPRRMD